MAWRALLQLYAARLQRPPSLGRWPDAQRARCAPGKPRDGEPKAPCEAWLRWGAKKEPRIYWGAVSATWRQRDTQSLQRVVASIEESLHWGAEFVESDVEKWSPTWSKRD